jgi:hypothetical protein
MMAGRRVRALFALAIVAGWLLAAPSRTTIGAAESGRFALIVQGASGGEQYAALHRKWLDGFAGILRDKFKYDAEHLVVLSEQPKAGEDRSTADGVTAALKKFATVMKPTDQLFVLLIGHGTADATDGKFNLIGRDLTVTEWNALLKPIAGRIVVVDTTSASFPYLAGLAGPNRVVMTATNRNAQVFDTVFAEGFLAAFGSDAADADKNGRISLLEAFLFASRSVKQHYEQTGTMAVEVAVFDDDGDGKGRDATMTGPDGNAAAVTYLDAVAVPTSSNPELQPLIVKRQELTEQVDDLRRRRTSMSAADFDKQFEQLVTELAVVSRDLRRRGIQ